MRVADNGVGGVGGEGEGRVRARGGQRDGSLNMTRGGVEHDHRLEVEGGREGEAREVRACIGDVN